DHLRPPRPRHLYALPRRAEERHPPERGRRVRGLLPRPDLRERRRLQPEDPGVPEAQHGLGVNGQLVAGCASDRRRRIRRTPVHESPAPAGDRPGTHAVSWSGYDDRGPTVTGRQQAVERDRDDANVRIDGSQSEQPELDLLGPHIDERLLIAGPADAIA